MVDMTLNDFETKVKVIHFGTNRRYDFLHVYAVNSNFCSRTHRLATMHNVTDDRRTQRSSATVSTVG